jgi:hypothetical protein
MGERSTIKFEATDVWRGVVWECGVREARAGAAGAGLRGRPIEVCGDGPPRLIDLAMAAVRHRIGRVDGAHREEDHKVDVSQPCQRRIAEQGW